MTAPRPTPRPVSPADRVANLSRFARQYERQGCTSLALATWDEVLKLAHAARSGAGDIPSVRGVL